LPTPAVPTHTTPQLMPNLVYDIGHLLRWTRSM